MIFGRPKKSLNEVLLDAIGELGKCYSRLELAYKKLAKRNRELFEECSIYLSRGLKNRAIIYANEVAEIRKIMKFIESIQLNLERAILRLETLKTVTPTMEEIKGVFGEVKSILGDVARIMPSLAPELENLTSSINELIMATEINMTPPEPLAIGSEEAEAILKEASEFVAQELEKKIPEPPVDLPLPPTSKSSEAIKPRIALTVNGVEAHVGEDDLIIGDVNDGVSPLAEELVLDYIERNNGIMNVAKCSKELNMPQDKIVQILESLSRKGKIKIE